MLKGIGASQGYGIGRVVVVEEVSLDYTGVSFTTVENEKARLNNSKSSYATRTKELISELNASNITKEAEILQGHLAMLDDPFMLSQMIERIENGSTAERAVDLVCKEFFDMLNGVDDELIRQRASDVDDIRTSLLKLLMKKSSIDLSKLPSGTVLVAKDLTPSLTSQLNGKNVEAIICEAGGITSHSAILARAMGIPAVLSATDATTRLADSDMVVVDGFKGEVIVQPSDSELAEYHKKQENYLSQRASLQEYYNKPTVTKSGASKLVCGNIASAEDVHNVLQNGGDGVGLFRSEFLFMHRDSEPSEEEQLEAYSTVAKAMDNKEVTIRTLDVGGDKAIEYLSIQKEENPFLGNRGIRYCLDNVDLFKRQLRAILRASVYGNIRVLLPMITTVDEVKRAKDILAECMAELDSEGVNYSTVPLGVMIETPSAVMIADELAREVDFFSIGTNDLTGYIMAVDRGNKDVAHLYDSHQMSVMRAIEHIIKAGKRVGITIGMCGEAAQDEELIPLLLKWGLDEFSVSASAILQTRRAICLA